jgi:hypothetical protein
MPAIAHRAPAQLDSAVHADMTRAARRRTPAAAAQQERRGTDPLMAGINTRCGALAPHA